MENYAEKINEFCQKLMTEQYLERLNEVGKELGYPFVMYSNGECGKGLVSADRKHNAVLKVLGSFKGNARVDGLKQPHHGKSSVVSSPAVKKCPDEARLASINKAIDKERGLSAEDECFLAQFGTLAMLRDYAWYADHFSFDAFKQLVARNRIFALSESEKLWIRQPQLVDYLIEQGSPLLVGIYLQELELTKQQEKILIKRRDFNLLDIYQGDGKGFYCMDYLEQLARKDAAFKVWMDEFEEDDEEDDD